MSKRTYNMYCAIAKALDVVGERWTLLIVHEVLSGPKRFKDFLDNLPGIGTNLLSKRLKELEQADIIRHRKLPPPAASEVYEITEHGQGLEEVVLGLGRWGTPLLGLPKPDELFRPVWALYAMKDRFVPENAVGINKTYEFHIDDDILQARVEDQQIFPTQGAAWKPDVVITMDSATLLDIGTYQLDPLDAHQQGRVRVQGDVSDYVKFFQLLVDAESGVEKIQKI